MNSGFAKANSPVKLKGNDGSRHRWPQSDRLRFEPRTWPRLRQSTGRSRLRSHHQRPRSRTAYRNRSRLRNTTGANIVAVTADVATTDGQKALFDACPEPDILINNNAGPPFRDFRELDRQKMIDGVVANMIVAIELIQKAIDPMVAKEFGRIVNITSGSVKMPLVGLDLSSGARAGLTAFLAGVARSVAASHVTINFMLPGIFATDRLRSYVATTAKNQGHQRGCRACRTHRHRSGAARGQPGRIRRGLRISVFRRMPAISPAKIC